MELYLIRHGTMKGDPHLHMRPPVSDCLSETGVRQAAALGRALKDVEFSHIYSSPLGRALQTAQALRGERPLSIEVEPWLEEWRPAHVMAGSDATRFETMMARAAELPQEQTWKTEAGESLMQMADRIIPGMQVLLARHGARAGHGGYVFANPDNADRIALVAHGGSLNVLMKFLLDLPLKPGACFHFKETGVALLGFHRVVDVWYPHLHIPPPLFPLEST